MIIERKQLIMAASTITSFFHYVLASGGNNVDSWIKHRYKIRLLRSVSHAGKMPLMNRIFSLTVCLTKCQSFWVMDVDEKNSRFKSYSETVSTWITKLMTDIKTFITSLAKYRIFERIMQKFVILSILCILAMLYWSYKQSVVIICKHYY